MSKLKYADKDYKLWAQYSLKNHGQLERLLKTGAPIPKYRGNSKRLNPWRGVTVYFGWRELAEKAKRTPYCEVCGVELDYEQGKKGGSANYNSPSMDRIDSSKKDITIEDIQILCFQCNSAKSNMTPEEWISHSKKLNESFKTNNPELYHSVRDWNEYMSKYDPDRDNEILKRYGVKNEDLE
jgi:hypothetical protein